MAKKKYIPAQPKKRSLVLRIIVLLLAVALVIGILIMPLQINAEESGKDIVVSSFETGKLSEAVNEAADGTDFNYIFKVAVFGGTMNADDYAALLNIPNLEYAELAGAETEDGIVPENALPSRNKLIYVSLPSNTVEIGARAFSNNKQLVKIDMPAGLKKIGDGAFEFCETLEKFPMTASVEYIGEGAFNSCKSFTSFTIPDGITEIYANTFSKCGFAEISVPASVKRIDDGAFADCNNLKDIYVYGEDTAISGDGTFRNVSATIHVFDEFADNYSDWEGNNIKTEGGLVETEAPAQAEPESDLYGKNDEASETEAAAETEAEISTEASSENTAKAASTEPADEKSSGVSIWVVIVAVAVTAAAAVAATVIVMKKKK